MTNLTIKFPSSDSVQETKILMTFYRLFPAFYNSKTDEITLTCKIESEEFKYNFCDIINHEYLHSIIANLEGKDVCRMLDNILDDIYEYTKHKDNIL